MNFIKLTELTRKREYVAAKKEDGTDAGYNTSVWRISEKTPVLVNLDRVLTLSPIPKSWEMDGTRILFMESGDAGSTYVDVEESMHVIMEKAT